ncbi:MAG: lipopolysaccharide kinase InaA family protein [Candidatus Malihini olakiniferum]
MLKNLLSLRLPALCMEREWNAIHRLHDLSVDIMIRAAFGRKGLNPLQQESFIITAV